MLIVLRNDVHGTTARVQAGTLSEATVRRVRRALRNGRIAPLIPNGSVGGLLGEHGSQRQPNGGSVLICRHGPYIYVGPSSGTGGS